MHSLQLPLIEFASETPLVELLEENPGYLQSQLITYLGNKRALLPFIEQGIQRAKNALGREKITFLDLFSGSGVVSRLARRHAKQIVCNDLELYSHMLNSCYQTNPGQAPIEDINKELNRLRSTVESAPQPGFIRELYSAVDDANIKPGERVFYTTRNAIFLDTFCQALSHSPAELRPYLLSPILCQASMYVNTSGVFKGFYKNKAGVGQFGGEAKNALARIKRNIVVQAPIFSRFSCEVQLLNGDANQVLSDIEPVDIAYFDPPYNQHPYGSNYFMLNLLCEYKRPEGVSDVSGIPSGWKRSAYNKRSQAEDALLSAVANVRANFVLLSYNCEGFISKDAFLRGLSEIGPVEIMDTSYNAFRGSRNLASRDIHVTEFLFLVDKR